MKDFGRIFSKLIEPFEFNIEQPLFGVSEKQVFGVCG